MFEKIKKIRATWWYKSLIFAGALFLLVTFLIKFIHRTPEIENKITQPKNDTIFSNVGKKIVDTNNKKSEVQLDPEPTTDQEDPYRYFYVSYSTIYKKDNNTITGWTSFGYSGFPSKNVIDSLIRLYFEYSRNCYQSIVITSIYEFNDAEDFNDFGRDYKSAKKYKKKKPCPDDQIRIHAANSRILHLYGDSTSFLALTDTVEIKDNTGFYFNTTTSDSTHKNSTFIKK